jgi:hypothetical protein
MYLHVLHGERGLCRTVHSAGRTHRSISSTHATMHAYLNSCSNSSDVCTPDTTSRAFLTLDPKH